MAQEASRQLTMQVARFTRLENSRTAEPRALELEEVEASTITYNQSIFISVTTCKQNLCNKLGPVWQGFIFSPHGERGVRPVRNFSKSSCEGSLGLEGRVFDGRERSNPKAIFAFVRPKGRDGQVNQLAI